MKQRRLNKKGHVIGSLSVSQIETLSKYRKFEIPKKNIRIRCQFGMFDIHFKV